MSRVIIGSAAKMQEEQGKTYLFTWSSSSLMDLYWMEDVWLMKKRCLIRPQVGAWDGDEGLYSSGDNDCIGVVTHLPVNELTDNITEVTPHEGKVNTRGMHVVKVACR